VTTTRCVHAILLGLTLAVSLSFRAEAAPILVSFSDTLPAQNGPLDGLLVSGSFSYDDPFGLDGCVPDCTFGPLLTLPMLSLSLNVGPYHFDLSQAMPGAHVQGPLGHIVWGPVVQIAPQFLPSGITGIFLEGDALIRFFYTTPHDVHCCFEPAPTFTLLPHSVPGPGALALCASALAAVAVRTRSRRGRSRRSAPHP
jgi:hypothetical protein